MIRRLLPWAGWPLAALFYALWRVTTIEAWGWRFGHDLRHGAACEPWRHLDRLP